PTKPLNAESSGRRGAPLRGRHAERLPSPAKPGGKEMVTRKASRRKWMRALFFRGTVGMAAEKTIYDSTINWTTAESTPPSRYRGKIVLLVNVASRCGFTPQYVALEKVYEKYKSRGLVILGFPANNFGGQEPGSNQEIKTFCSTKYNVTFPMMAKVSVKGDDQTPLYQFLTDKSANPQTGGEIKWKFTKFLIGPSRRPEARF